MSQIDKDWFMQQLQDQKKSVRGMARFMDLDASAVSRMLSGERRMKTEEAAQIARFLGSPLKEVLSHAGVAVDLDGAPTRVILASVVSASGNIERLMEARPLPQAFIDRAQAALRGRNASAIAAQVRADDGPLAIWDDAVLLFGATETVEHDAIGSLSVCRLLSGEQILARIERARKTGEARVVDIYGQAREVQLQTATPVLAVIP